MLQHDTLWLISLLKTAAYDMSFVRFVVLKLHIITQISYKSMSDIVVEIVVSNVY